MCDAAIRPFPNDTEVRCSHPTDHTGMHAGLLIGYAGKGSQTILKWEEGDRRNYHGKWPGACCFGGCGLPLGHGGNCI